MKLSKKQTRIAKKSNPKLPHSTRPFTLEDYFALPSDPERQPVK